jgi:hypothetical protein
MTELWTRALQRQLSTLNTTNFQGTTPQFTPTGDSITKLMSQITDRNTRERIDRPAGAGGGAGGGGGARGSAISDVFRGGKKNPPQSGGSEFVHIV